MKRKIITLATLLLASSGIYGCNEDANMASYNISKAADMFEVNRRIVFYNSITDAYMFTVEGRCSIKIDGMDRQLEVTCKDGPKSFKKSFLGLSDNVTYFAEQLDPVDASVYYYRVIFKPQSIIPNIDFRSSLTD